MPETRLNAVVLPAPFGPISACKVRSRTREGHAFDSLDAAEMLDDALGLEDRPVEVRAGFRNCRQRRVAYLAAGHRRGLHGVLRKGASTRSATPTRPVGENTMKPTNSRPN